MKTEKKFRIIKEFTAYSKKKGAHVKRIVVENDIATYEDAVAMIKKWHPEAVVSGNIVKNVGGLIYPTTYEIK